MARKRIEIIKNPNPKARVKYMSLINPIGDRTFGYLGWDKKKGFKTKLEARRWAKKQIAR